MELPNVPVSPEILLNEYHDRLAGVMAANIRLVGMVHALVFQRDAAIRRVAELEDELRGWESAQTKAVHIGSPPGV